MYLVLNDLTYGSNSTEIAFSGSFFVVRLFSLSKSQLFVEISIVVIFDVSLGFTHILYIFVA